jgi:hypothetical protein
MADAAREAREEIEGLPASTQNTRFGMTRTDRPDNQVAEHIGGSGRVREAAVRARDRRSGALCPEQSGRGS